MKKVYTLFLLSIFLISILATQIYLLTNNTLSNNNNWNSEKLKLGMGVMGAWNFFNQTQPLNRNQLNLGAWHGFQEIITKESFKYNQIEFDALINQNAYLISHFAITDGQKFSIKLSADDQESSCLVIDQFGKFTDKKTLNNLAITPNQWNHIIIIFDNNESLISVNGQSYKCPTQNLIESKIGFKNGYSSTLIDNVILKNNDQTIFQDEFNNNKNFTFISLSTFLSLALIQLLIYLVLVKIFKDKKKTLFLLTSLNTSLILSLITLYFYLLFSFTGNYPNLDSLLNNFKSQEQEWVDNELEIISQEVMNTFVNDENEKIMFIGSSQTWGAGASDVKSSFPLIFEELLNKKISTASESSNIYQRVLGVSTDQEIRVVNTGISGTTSSELFDEYKSEWISLKPKLVFINLSSNDFTYDIPEEIFRENIKNFINLNKQSNIKTILLIEASSKEIDEENYFQETLKEIAQKEEIIIIDVNQYLKEKNDSGLIWWDFIHPTDYGHKLIAEYILNKLTENNIINQ